MTDVVTDEKAGWSSMCRRGEVRMCMTAGARCTNPEHGAKEGRRPERQRPVERGTTVTETRQQAKPTIALVWEDPPPDGRGHKQALRDRMADVLDQCRERPGEWARVATYPKAQSASSAANSLKKRPPEGKWEFVSRVLTDGEAGLYARFVK